MGNERILNGKPISDLQQSDDYTDILCTSTSPSIKTERKEIEEGIRHYTVNVKEPKKKLVSSQKGTIFFFFVSILQGPYLSSPLIFLNALEMNFSSLVSLLGVSGLPLAGSSRAAEAEAPDVDDDEPLVLELLES